MPFASASAEPLSRKYGKPLCLYIQVKFLRFALTCEALTVIRLPADADRHSSRPGCGRGAAASHDPGWSTRTRRAVAAPSAVVASLLTALGVAASRPSESPPPTELSGVAHDGGRVDAQANKNMRTRDGHDELLRGNGHGGEHDGADGVVKFRS